MERGELGDSHPIFNEWGRAWVVPGQLRAVLRQSMVNQRGNIFL
jgi:hypothetical protein